MQLQALPATVIGGYLGAGKTTLVNQLLRHANGHRLAILVNEFGAVSIDEDLIEAQSDELISIAGGCICCSFGSDLVAAMQEMLARTPRPDHVVIESSGVAMPGAIAASIGLIDGYNEASIIVLADTETVRAQAADEYLGDTVRRQLQDADLIVQTKTDLVVQRQQQDVAGWLHELNPRAVLLKADHGAVPNGLILGCIAENAVAVDEVTAIHGDHAFESRAFSAGSVDDPLHLARALSQSESGLIRVKGFVRDGDNRLWLVQTVGKRYSAEVITGQFRPQVVCIGHRHLVNWQLVDSLFQDR